MGELALQFAKIFAGLDRAHGWYEPNLVSQDAGKKVKGKAVTKQEPVTVELWEKHLAGIYGLGIVPLRADHTCVFGAIDVDIYNLDLKDLVHQVKVRGLPLVVCRTKSGGAHLYLFTKQPVPAPLLRAKLSEWCIDLGFIGKNGGPGMEIFPKQDHFEEGISTGNWINVPYCGGEDSVRYAIVNRALTPQEFIQYVDRVALNGTEDLEGTNPQATGSSPPVWAPAAPATKGAPAATGAMPLGRVSIEVAEDLLEAPPCIHHLATSGFPEGSRNNGLFNVALYAKKRFDAGWEDQAVRYNLAYMDPPLPDSEARTIINSVSRRNYGYKCKDQPIVSCCDRKTCLKREYGVGGGAKASEIGVSFGTMTKMLTKPVSWLWDVNGELVEFTTKDLMTQRLFQEKILETLSFWPPQIKPMEWQRLIQGAVADAEELEVPDDATSAGQLWEQLQKFCTSRLAGKNLDELLMGRPFTDDTRSYFVVGDFVSYLIQHRYPGKITEREIYLVLRSRGLQHHHSVLKGKALSYWSVPAFKTQTQDHDIPRDQPQDMM